MLLPFSLLIFTGLTASEVYHVPLLHVESKMIQMMREGTWAAHTDVMNAWRQKSMKEVPDNSIHSQNLNAYYDSEYVGNITIGNPEQTFQVLMSTGSADFWVIDVSCVPNDPEECEPSTCDEGLACEIFCPIQTCCKRQGSKRGKRKPCRGKRYFDSKNSDTYIKQSGQWKTKYLIGSAKGFYGNDTVRFGGPGTNQLVIKGTKFGQADEISETFAGTHFDGILGLAFYTLANSFTTPPFQYAAELGLVDPIFTVYMEHKTAARQNDFGGVITYGGLDEIHCGQVIAYQKVTTAMYWKFKMQSVSAGSYKSTNGWEVISDTGTSFIYAPSAIVFKLAEALNAVYHENEDVFYIDCKEDAKIVFGIGDHNYTIKAVNLIKEVKENVCIFMIHPDNTLAFFPSWILGSPFTRQYCNIHDMGKKKIGFAESLQK
ncbi:eukaryotic aspartyl protease [Necator americanus]|uniref:Eukaryotic aspartyl protease n=1 Tax=Necator americanus TaxID=51031 RepID=W2TB13_NECAM|nr:eukaryotic aspartyl protease [Necator americanus]ETN79053.1 eukaryotic aspartyl protease [Necator americanus]